MHSLSYILKTSGVKYFIPVIQVIKDLNWNMMTYLKWDLYAYYGDTVALLFKPLLGMRETSLKFFSRNYFFYPMICVFTFVYTCQTSHGCMIMFPGVILLSSIYQNDTHQYEISYKIEKLYQTLFNINCNMFYNL